MKREGSGMRPAKRDAIPVLNRQLPTVQEREEERLTKARGANARTCLRTFLGAFSASWDLNVEGEAGRSAAALGEWDETSPVGAAWGTAGDARQESAVLRDVSPSLLSPAYMNTHVFHGLRKTPSTLGSCCWMGITSPVLQC